MRRRTLAALVAACILGGSCSSPEEPAERSAAEAWIGLSRRIAREGSTARDALGAAALAFGLEIGGVRPPATTDPPLRSATGAVRLLLRHAGDLTDGQRREVEELLVPDGSGAGSVLDGLGLMAAAPLAGGGEEDELDVSIDPGMTERARRIADQLGSRIGYRLRTPVLVASGASDDDLGWMEPVRTRGEGPDRTITIQYEGTMETCLIALTIHTQLDAGRALASTLAHELLHCFQAELVGIDDWAAMEDFVVEGLAEWAGEAFVGGTAQGAIWWDWYLGDGVRLIERSYDAIGFWGQADAHIDGRLWPHLDDLIRLGGASGSLRGGAQLVFLEVVRVAERDFLDAWPAEVARRGELGRAWQLAVRDMDIPSDARRPSERIGLSENGYRHNLAPTRQELWRFDLTALPPERILSIQIRGHGHLAWEGTSPAEGGPLGGEHAERFCVGEECACGDTPVLPSSTLLVAMTAAEQLASLEIEVEECEGYEVPEEAIAAAFAERGIDFTWPCPASPDDPGYDDPSLHCIATGAAAPHRTAAGHVAFVRAVTEFHSVSYGVLMEGPEEIPGPLPPTPTGDEGAWQVIDVRPAGRVPAAWRNAMGPSFSPAEVVCVASRRGRCTAFEVRRG